MLNAFLLHTDKCRLTISEQKYNLIQDPELDVEIVGSCCSGLGLYEKPSYTNELQSQGYMNKVAKLFSI